MRPYPFVAPILGETDGDVAGVALAGQLRSLDRRARLAKAMKDAAPAVDKRALNI